MGDNDKQDSKIFQGFSSPNYTQVPDSLFDELLPELNAGELKVLLYLVRRIFGFKKESDNISISQICSGITTKEGRRLDYGTGLSKSTVTAALLALRKRGIIMRTRNSNFEKGNLPTTYRLRMFGDPLDIEEIPPLLVSHPLSDLPDKVVRSAGQGVSSQSDKLVRAVTQGMSGQPDTQETVKQETVNRDTDRIIDNSNGTPTKLSYTEVREELLPFVEDFAKEFKDEAPLRSSLSQMVNIYIQSGQNMDIFIDTIYDARLRTKEFSGSVTKESSGGGYGGKNRMPYFFKIVRTLVGDGNGRRQVS